MIDVNLNCSMCGKHRQIDDVICDHTTEMGEIINKAGWIWQENGDNFDIYCSEKCAK